MGTNATYTNDPKLLDRCAELERELQEYRASKEREERTRKGANRIKIAKNINTSMVQNPSVEAAAHPIVEAADDGNTTTSSTHQSSSESDSVSTSITLEFISSCIIQFRTL